MNRLVLCFVLLALATNNNVANAQTKKVLETFKKRGYTDIEIIKIERIYISYKDKGIDAIIGRNFTNSKSIKLPYGRSVSGRRYGGKHVYLVIYRHKGMKYTSVNIFSKNLKHIIR